MRVSSYHVTQVHLEDYVPRMVDEYIQIYFNPEQLKNRSNYLHLREDVNRTGILGELAVYTLLTGGRPEEYLLKRPTFQADEGYDIEHKGLKIDVKTQISKRAANMKWGNYICNLPETMLKKSPDAYVWVVKRLEDDLSCWVLGWLRKSDFEAKADRHAKGSKTKLGEREFTYTEDTRTIEAWRLNPMDKM